MRLDPLRLRVRRHRAHLLHQGERIWQEGDGYTDMWIELLHSHGFDPRAALGFCVAQDFEGDQFTALCFPADDLDKLFGLQIRELALYDALEERMLTQVKRGHTVLVEADAFDLPDTQPDSYHRSHARTMIGVDYMDAPARRLGYFHDTGYHVLDAVDYDHVVRRHADDAAQTQTSPRALFAKRVRAPLTGTPLADTSADLLCEHLLRRPARNPVSQWREALPEHIEAMLEHGEPFFRLYALNTMRRFGANFELLASHLRWLRKHGFAIPDEIPAAAQRIASESMVMQCRLARAVSRRRRDPCEECIDALEEAYAQVVPPLAALVC